jgi:hypothetical protein
MRTRTSSRPTSRPPAFLNRHCLGSDNASFDCTGLWPLRPSRKSRRDSSSAMHTSPQVGLLCHLNNQPRQLGVNARSSARPGLVFPKQTEAFAMPTDQRVAFDDGEGTPPVEQTRLSSQRKSGWRRWPGEVSLRILSRQTLFMLPPCAADLSCFTTPGNCSGGESGRFAHTPTDADICTAPRPIAGSIPAVYGEGHTC